MIKNRLQRGEKRNTYSVDILVVLRDNYDNRSFQSTLWLSSALEVEGGVALFLSLLPILYFHVTKILLN